MKTPLAWRTLYQAALLEADGSKIRTRIDAAHRAILDRCEDLNSSASSEERADLMNALNALRDLRKMADGAS